MIGFSALLLGIGLGLRHAMDADHIVVISALLEREPGRARAALMAALWGAGHTLAFLGVGLLIVLAGIHVPPNLERVAELAVAVMLIGLGLWHLLRAPARAVEITRPAGRSRYARPVLVGIVHGLGGSAGIALIATASFASRTLAAGYLLLFGLGTVAGMVVLTVVMSGPIAWTQRREGGGRRWARTAAALLSLGVGLSFLIDLGYHFSALRGV